MGGIAYAVRSAIVNIRRLKMRKHVIAAATATMFCIAAIGAAVAAETGTKTFPTSSTNPPPTPPPVWGDEPRGHRGHYVYPRHVYYPRHHYHHHYRVMN
jgi:hypothetical protein